MEIPEWKASEAFIGQYRAIQHIYNKSDIQLCGKSGVIWKTKTGYRALIDNIRLYKAHFGFWGGLKGEERLVSFGSESLDKMVKRLGVPRDVKQQIEYSKRFSA